MYYSTPLSIVYTGVVDFTTVIIIGIPNHNPKDGIIKQIVLDIKDQIQNQRVMNTDLGKVGVTVIRQNGKSGSGKNYEKRTSRRTIYSLDPVTDLGHLITIRVLERDWRGGMPKPGWKLKVETNKNPLYPTLESDFNT